MAVLQVFQHAELAQRLILPGLVDRVAAHYGVPPLMRRLVCHNGFQRLAPRVQQVGGDHHHGGVFHAAHGEVDLAKRIALVGIRAISC